MDKDKVRSSPFSFGLEFTAVVSKLRLIPMVLLILASGALGLQLLRFYLPSLAEVLLIGF